VSKKWLILLITLASLAAMIAIRLLVGFPIPAISVTAEPIPGLVLPIPGFPLRVTNSLLTAWLAMLLLVLFALWVRRGLQTIPNRRQSLAEMLIEALYGLVVSVAGEKWAPAFFPIIATIFLFVLVSNLMDPLTPILAAVGVKEHGNLIPLLRSPSTDLNFTVALALVSVGLTQYYGLRANGLLGYLGKYLNIRGFIKFFRLLLNRQPKAALGALFMGIIDFFIGIIEIISEFAKIISFSFRLFGNIFAGEVLLIIIPYLIPFLLPLPFLGLEVFVSFIQAFIFAVLTLAFLRMATLTHGAEAH